MENEGLVGLAHELAKSFLGQVAIILFVFLSILRILSSFVIISIVDSDKAIESLKDDLSLLSLEEIIKKFEREDLMENPLLREFQIFLVEKKLEQTKKETELLSNKLKELGSES